jgi:hypothetical protein
MAVEGIDAYSTYTPPAPAPAPETQAPPPEESSEPVQDQSSGQYVDTSA